MSKKIIILAILLFAILSIYTISKNTKFKNNLPVVSPITMPTPTTPAESSLLFSPDILYTNNEQYNEVNIQINSQGKYPTLLQFELAYDPTILTNVSLTSGTFFSNPDILLNDNDETNGRISYALSLKPDQKPQTFTGIAAKLKFNVKKNTSQTQTAIYFLPKTAIRALNENIPLKVAYGIKIFINQSATASAVRGLR